MKTLKFRKKLAELIKTGEKTTTWRLFDDKNISEGNIISLIVWETEEEFGKAKVTSTKETIFKNLSEKDWKTHEKFDSKKEMLQTYSKYYNQKVNEETSVKVIKFRLI